VIRVIHIISTDSLAGTEQYLLQLLAHASPGIAISVCCPESGVLYPALRARGARVACFDFSPRALPSTTLQLARHLRQERPTVVHVHLGRATLAGAIAARLAGVPIVVATQHFILPAYASTHRPLFRPLFRLGHRLVNRLLTRVIICSQAAGKAMHDREHLSSAKLVHVPHGIDLAEFPAGQDRRALRLARGLPLTAPLIVTVGRLEWEKGYDVLIEASPLIVAAHPDAQFAWVGSGSQAGDYQARLVELGLADREHLLGQRADVPACMALADLAVCPTPLESFGLAVVEAMAAGLPVVAIDAGGPAEIVVPGETGWLVPYAAAPRAAAVNRLLADSAAARAMGAAGRRRVAACYTVERMVRETEAVYRDLIAAGRAARDRPMEAR
jgi:glycosyltransferase involved in cell wall biosynthesis